MKLIYRISLRLSAVLLPLLTLWVAVFYFAMIDEINDETDDALEDYSELIIIRKLAGQPLPRMNEGSNNSYSITPITEEYAAIHPNIEYYDTDVYIPEKEETEPARILTTIFRDNDNRLYELKVATPTFEKDDLLKTILGWTIFLYVILLVTVISIVIWVFHKSMQPLYALLRWLDNYTPGKKKDRIPNDTRVTEFRQLNIAAQQAVDRTENLFEQQKQFIGNASHELQTPLAILGNRLEWLIDQTDPSELQMEEFLKMQHTLSHIVRLNKTLLLLAKIENGQFPETSDIDIASLVQEQIELYNEIYDEKGIVCRISPESTDVTVKMNETLASVLLSNLIRNACIHSPANTTVEIHFDRQSFVITNAGEKALDGDRIFDRFYQGQKKEGSTGLGLALVKAVANYYNLSIKYGFKNGRHEFRIYWQ